MRRIVIRFRLWTLALLVAAALAVPGAGASATPHVLHYNYDTEDITSLNPFLGTSASTRNLSELTMAQFTRFDAAGDPVPELITTIPTKANGGVSADGRTVTWHLRHGVRWSDGVPFSAADVAFTYRVAMDPANSITRRDVWEKLTGVATPDPYTVVFHFKQPYALFIADYLSTLSDSCVLPAHVIGPGTAINQAAYNSLPVGIGAFRYTAYHRGDSIELEANPYYWRGKPKLERIVYKIVPDYNTAFAALQTGDLDLWQLINGTIAQRARTLPGIGVVTTFSNALTGVRFNVTRPVVSDPRVRRALRLATDRKTIVDKIALGNGAGQESVVPRVTHDYLALPESPYDPGRAAALLDEAGWKRGSDGMRARDGVPLTIDLAIPAGYAPSISTANLLHDDWGAIGVGVSIHTYATGEFFQPISAGGPVMSGRFDAAIFSNAPGPLYANVNGIYDCASFPPNGFNITRYCNKAVDAENDRYLRSFDPAVRAQAAAAFQRQIDADAPVAIIYSRALLDAFTTRLTGYHPNAFSDWGDPLELDVR